MSKAEQTDVMNPPVIGDVLVEDTEEDVVQPNVVFVRFPFSSSYGGEEKHTLEIAQFYKKKGAKVSFVGSCKVLLEMFDNAGFEVEKRWLSKPPVSAGRLFWFTLLSPILFVKALVDVFCLKLRYGSELKFYMLGFGEKLLWSPWAWLFGIDSLWLEHARFGNWFHKNPWKLWFKFWSKRKNVKVITVSELMKKELGMDWVTVIPNAVDGLEYKQIRDASTLPSELKKAFARKNTDIGFLGRFSKDKGIDILLDLAENFPEVGFICCGDGVMKKHLDKADVDNMWLDPKLVPCFLQNIELLIVPSTLTDPFGLVVLEAMHAGTPVLMSDKCGVAWHLEDGVNAFICKPEEFVERFAEIMDNKDLLKEVAANLPLALEQFDYEEMLENYWFELTVW